MSGRGDGTDTPSVNPGGDRQCCDVVWVGPRGTCIGDCVCRTCAIWFPSWEEGASLVAHMVKNLPLESQETWDQFLGRSPGEGIDYPPSILGLP